MSRIRAFLVDLDGTLADTAAANFEAYSAALGEVGAGITRERFDAVVQGRNWKQFLPTLLDEAEIDADPARIARRKAEIYATKLDRILVNSALVRLLASNRPACGTALVTTASAVNVRAILAHHELAALFDAVVTGDDVSQHKPDPEAYRLAASRLGVAPEDCLVFEDSDIGVASARAFGGAVLRIRIT
jgi:HAD superfamily hydrolase (TIGR01509 family)